jgi:glycosyltransferase involved in cell wall biosynthesis
VRIALATDAWRPQLNGVVVTLENTVQQLQRMGHEVWVIEPSRFLRCPFPGYLEVELALAPGAGVERELLAFMPDAVHIATEGPIGLAARAFCLRRGWPFTTAFHTRFPEYLSARRLAPAALTYAYLRCFHSPAQSCLVSTPSLEKTLLAQGFGKLARWERGVDTERFRPAERVGSWIRPVFGYLGRLAIEKGVDDFLRLDLPGTRLVIGDGPEGPRLRRQYPDATFMGRLEGELLARLLPQIDVLVFPSRTDTFGLVMLEALACGVPIAAYPITGPVDIVREGETGALDESLRHAAERALRIDPRTCRRFALERSWHAATTQFLRHLAPIDRTQRSLLASG